MVPRPQLQLANIRWRSAQITGWCSGVFHFFASGKEPMCLYGYPDGSWELTLPEEMVPPGLPEPTRGINRRSEYVNRNDYLSFVARSSDSWLMGVAFFLTTHLDANQRYVTTKLLLLLLLLRFTNSYFMHLTFRTFICAMYVRET